MWQWNHAHTCEREAAGKKRCSKVEYQIIMMSFSLLVLRTVSLLSGLSSRDASQKSAEEANIIIRIPNQDVQGTVPNLAVRELAH